MKSVTECPKWFNVISKLFSLSNEFYKGHDPGRLFPPKSWWLRHILCCHAVQAVLCRQTPLSRELRPSELMRVSAADPGSFSSGFWSNVANVDETFQWYSLLIRRCLFSVNSFFSLPRVFNANIRIIIFKSLLFLFIHQRKSFSFPLTAVKSLGKRRHQLFPC